MKTETGSTRTFRPTWNVPAESQVQRVDVSLRSLLERVSIEAKETIAAANDTATAAVARKPTARAGIRMPPATISTAAASGENRQTHAAAVKLSAQRRQQV